MNYSSVIGAAAFSSSAHAVQIGEFIALVHAGLRFSGRARVGDIDIIVAVSGSVDDGLAVWADLEA